MIPYGLFVLGAKHGEEIGLATVNWVTQTSFGPPRVVIGVKGDSITHALLETSMKFALSMLKIGQKDIACTFFKHLPPENGKAGGCANSPAENGALTLDDAAGHVAGDIVDVIKRGDHSILVGEVTKARLQGKDRHSCSRRSAPITAAEAHPARATAQLATAVPCRTIRSSQEAQPSWSS